MKKKSLQYNNPLSLKKGNSKTIFTVHAKEALKFKPSEHSLSRTFGWFSTLKLAKRSVEKNDCDIHECAYQYVVIEEIKEGILGTAVKEWWYKWNNQRQAFLPIPKPKETLHIINWGLG